MTAEVITVFVFGVVFVVAMLILAVAFPRPTPFQYTTFRIVLALAVAGIAAMIPGFINLELTSTVGLLVRAGGALAVFVIVFFFSPANAAIAADPTSAAQSSTLIIRAEVQRYHIIRGATDAPRLLPPIHATIAEYEASKGEVVQHVVDAIRPRQTVDVLCAIEGNVLEFPRPSRYSLLAAVCKPLAPIGGSLTHRPNCRSTWTSSLLVTTKVSIGPTTR